eukprot:135686-Pelagomonas_calceolata.AAC.1
MAQREQQRGAQSAEGVGQDAEGGGQGAEGSDQDAELDDQAYIDIPPCPTSKTMKRPTKRK